MTGRSFTESQCAMHTVCVVTVYSLTFYSCIGFREIADIAGQARVNLDRCNLHSLQAANCCRNSRLVVNEDDMKWVTI